MGRHGSGTIFFTYCNLRCVFCQNYTISQLGEGDPVGKEELARMMLSLQARGCHNINLVSPTHVVPYILEALETLALLDGIVDIYMPDMKYSEGKIAEQLSGIKDYPQVNQAAIKEMHHQVGDLKIDKQGVAQRGLLVRHLVLPNRLAGTQEVVRFLAREVSTNTYLNIMAQYHPCYKAFDIPSLARSLQRQEFTEALDLAHQQGLYRLDKINFPLPLKFIL